MSATCGECEGDLSYDGQCVSCDYNDLLYIYSELSHSHDLLQEKHEDLLKVTRQLLEYLWVVGVVARDAWPEPSDELSKGILHHLGMIP